MDLLDKLRHDHAPLAEGMARLRLVLNRVGVDTAALVGARLELMETAEQLREELMEHFADEEELLFPWLASELPQHQGRLARLEGAHDRICGALDRFVHALHRGDAISFTIAEPLNRLEQAYSEHTTDELALLHEVVSELTPEQRERLTREADGLI